MHPYYPTLFSPYQLPNGVVLKNRMICPPNAPSTIQGAENYPTDHLIRHYAQRARNGAAIVTTSGCYLEPADPKGHSWGWNAEDGSAQNAMSELAEAIHAYGSLCNGFLIGFPEDGYDVSCFDLEKNSEIRCMLSPSFCEHPKELTTEMVYEHIDRYVRQVKAMAECGFDGVNIHMSYRFSLPARFLSPMTNLRTDEFGGDFAGRTLFCRKLCEGIKKACGKRFVIEVTIAGYDPVDDGWATEDSIRFSQEMHGLVDIMTMRSSTVDPQHPIGYAENPRPWVHMAADVKAGGPKIAVAASSGLFDPDANEALLAAGDADLVSMARAFISNPDYGKLVYEGRKQDLVPCLRCNKCLRAGPSEPWLTVCAVNPARGMEHFMKDLEPLNDKSKKVAVIGGGPAGIQAAMSAQSQGHEVHLFEKTDRLGGLLNHCDTVSFKWPLRDYRDFIVRKIQENAAITIHMNCAPTPEELEQQGFEVVIAALGSRPSVPPIPGVETAGVVFGKDVFGHEDQLGQRVVIIGGGEIGVECGIQLCRKGHTVTVLEMTDMLAREANHGHYYSMVKAAWEKEPSFTGLTNATCTAMTEHSVTYQDAAGVSHTIPCDSIVLSAGMQPNTAEALEYAGVGSQFRLIGDCQKPGSVQQAVRNGWTAGRTI